MKLFRFFHTTRHFQPAQIRHKIFYELKKARAEKGKFHLADSNYIPVSPVAVHEDVPVRPAFNDGVFTFLNRSHHLGHDPDWNYSQHGSQWNTCLNSFDYLHQQGLDPEVGLGWMKSYLGKFPKIKKGYDAFCVSRRLIHWLPFISGNQIADPDINSFLRKQADYLSGNPEWHLRNNHLLENGFALVRAGIYFSNKKYIDKGEAILTQELPVQVLSDGAHAELSPMYHSVMLWRMLETMDLLNKSSPKISPLKNVLHEKAGIMCGWLKNMMFESGELPQFNDSTADGMPPWPALFQLADHLKMKCVRRPLGESGFRKFQNRHFELLADVNGLSPTYAPGHAHADALHFILGVFGSPFIIDTGVSTYEAGPDRDYERSTRAHNTVVINGQSQSEVYGQFRAGRKAKVTVDKDNSHVLSATCDGYKRFGAMHNRTFEFGDREILIRDTVHSSGQPACSAFLHIDKKCGLKKEGSKLHSRFVNITFEGANNIKVGEKWNSPAFGVKIPAWEVGVDFSGTLVTRISIS